MTIRVKIEVPASEAYGVQVGRESLCGKVGQHIGTVLPGHSLETYFWKENKLVLTEVELAKPVEPQPTSGLLGASKIDPLEATVNAVISSKESYDSFK